MTSFSDESLQTVSGTVTAWLPISSPWLSIAACSSQIYAQRAGLGGNLIAFDPLYGESIVPSAIPCLPTEVTSSWYQTNSAITTVLGPTFMCPGAYSAVETILVNSFTQQILCCPSNYGLNVPITGKGTFPSQCTSSLTSGQTLTYESTTPGGPWGVATSTIPASTAVSTGPTIVFGMHVNGFNVISTSTTASSSLVITSGPLASSTSSNPTSQTPAASTNTSAGSSSLSKGAAAGIGIGFGCLAIAALIGAWFFFRRNKKAKQKADYTATMAGPYEVDSSNAMKPKIHEADSSNSVRKPRIQSLHEMPAT